MNCPSPKPMNFSFAETLPAPSVLSRQLEVAPPHDRPSGFERGCRKPHVLHVPVRTQHEQRGEGLVCTGARAVGAGGGDTEVVGGSFGQAFQRNRLPDPFLELQAPPKPRQESSWLTRAEFVQLLNAAAHPPRYRHGLAERDLLGLLALVTTGLRRSELIALSWGDVTLDGPRPSVLVRRSKGGRPRRQPLPAQLA